MTEEEKDQVILDQQAEIVSLKLELASTVEVNKGLSKQIEQGSIAPAPAPSAETFEIDGKTVSFAFRKMKHNGIVITPAEVLASEDLQKELYEQQSGMLKY